MRTMSNYFVKGTTKTGEPVTLPIEADNVFTTCPSCGKKHPVDFELIACQDPEFDLNDTRVYCSECSKKRQREKRQLHLL